MSQIKTCIYSRWKQDGVIIQADYSQLEVFGLAFLSKDQQLKKDLLDGLDMHCLNTSFIYDEPYTFVKTQVDAGNADWIKKRKIAKGPGFLIQYGGGHKLMAKETGLTEATCKEFIFKYYDRYKEVYNWQQANIRAVKLTRATNNKIKTPKGFPAGIGKLKSITGRVYTFIETDSEFDYGRNSKTAFTPTKIKNYPVQGFATGDIVPECCGRMFRTILNDKTLLNKLLMINTVHDSLIFDCHVDVLDHALITVKETLENAPTFLKNRFDIDFDMPLRVDIEVGETWGEMLKINF